jgi:hypothetical protein
VTVAVGFAPAAEIDEAVKQINHALAEKASFG